MRIHFVGICGVSMRALSLFALSRGATVSGSDRSLSGHDPAFVEGADLVVYTDAVEKDNPELVRARELNIPVIERAVYLGELSAAYKSVIAVSGCHGKSTATAMLGKVFASRSPTVHVGVAGGSVIGSNDIFITEACEFKRNFLHLAPDIGVVLNFGYDHPDCYPDERSLINAYAEFCANSKKVIVNGDDEISRALTDRPITFGLGKNNDYRATDIVSNRGMRAFDVRGKTNVHIRLSVAGEHNVYNALAAVAVGVESGLSLTQIKNGLSAFHGIARRFEFKGVAFGKAIFTDYAHHPDEIAATIRTAKEMYKRVGVIFQPHTFTRTQSLMDEFAAALARADTVALAPIYSARENPIDGVNSHALCRKTVLNNERTYCFDTFCEIEEFCRNAKTDALIFMGAGDINTLADKIIDKE